MLCLIFNIDLVYQLIDSESCSFVLEKALEQWLRG